MPVNKINLKLESLRGFAALFVVIGHVFYYHKYFDKSFFPAFPDVIFDSTNTAHISVLIFFILSGYVIGASNKINLTWATTLAYLKKRTLRLYPIYFVCILFALIIATHSYPIKTILSNFTFTQAAFTEVIWENNPIWSLNYEVLYYLLFIPISVYNINPIIVFFSSIAIALTGNHLCPDIPIIPSYFYGFSFWVIGLCIAKYSNNQKQEVSSTKLVAVIFFIMALDRLLANSGVVISVDNILDKFTVMVHDKYWATIIIPIRDLVLLPYCSCIVMLFAGNNFRYQKLMMLILQIPVLFAIIHFLSHFSLNYYLLVSIAYYMNAVVLYVIPVSFFDQLCLPIIKTGTWLGAISYGIYVVHFPILVSIGRLDIFLVHKVPAYMLKFLLYLLLVVFCSFVLEKKYQPFIKKVIG